MWSRETRQRGDEGAHNVRGGEGSRRNMGGSAEVTMDKTRPPSGDGAPLYDFTSCFFFWNFLNCDWMATAAFSVSGLSMSMSKSSGRLFLFFSSVEKREDEDGGGPNSVISSPRERRASRGQGLLYVPNGATEPFSRSRFGPAASNL
ncbi:hypothetical protein EYF80_013073 [Liparis tanakae]|uniref:Uncharacterized protein n=1 Tax=Liparis tanakae TaxID=230148 RepID=A0A4Z2IFR7_9TELE|nr:hypothetical protein EYF80_013073 [Liparis tanakae]